MVFLLAILLVAFEAMPAEASNFTVFGPQYYERTAGPPDTYSFTFTAPTFPVQYVLRVLNGDPAAGRHHARGTITLNGVQIFGPSELQNNGVNVLEKPVALSANNQLDVTLDGKPNTGLTIMVVGIDKTPPTITASTSPAANANGWNNTNVTVTFICSDNLSGIASCPAPVTVTTEGVNQHLTGTATDKAGNTASTTVTLNIDKSVPTISAAAAPAPNANGWDNAAVTVTFTCSDALSGIAACPAPVTVSAEGGNQSVSGTAIDKAGNSASAGITVSIDKTPPTITAAAVPPANSSGWNNANVTVTFTCADALSGILTCPPATNLSSEGQNQNASGTATDKAGNTAAASVTVNLDKTPPSITASVSPAPNANGWNNANPTVTFTCTDALSGVASCPPAASVATEGASQAVNGTATDLAGNSATATATVNLDKTPPSITASISPAPNANGWNNASATVTFTCTDALSGVMTCPPATNLTSEGQNQNAKGTATDKAGNIATASVTVNLDKTPPSITASVSPSPNAKGWNAANVTVTFTCTDALSGVASCPTPASVTAEGASQTVAGTANDQAGNSATANATVNLDKTPPVISIASPVTGNVVTNAPMTVTGTVSDSLSGVATVMCNSTITASVSGTAFSCPVALTQGVNTINVQAQDQAGNTASASVTVTLNIKPIITAKAAPSPNANGWNNTNVVVTFTCSQPSGTIASCTPPVTVSTEGANQVITGTAVDNFGSSATTSVTLTIDKTPPALAVTSPANNAMVSPSSITVTGTVSDALSGLTMSPASCNNVNATVSGGNFSCSVPLNAGLNTITVQATDLAGNMATQTLTVNKFVPPTTGPIPVTWINPACVTINGNSLQKSATTSAWDCGAASGQVIRDGYGFVEFTATEANTFRMIGLSNRYSGHDYSFIDYGVFLRHDGTINIYEAGTPITPQQPYQAGDRFRVEVRYGVVRYLQNGTLFYTSVAVPVYPLRAIASFYSPNATVTDVRVGNLVWSDAAGAVVSGESLNKTVPDGWNAGAISTKTIESGDGYLEFTATETNTTRAAGLANAKTGQTTADIAFGFELHSDGSLEIIESGTSRGTFGVYLGGDRLRVEALGGVVRYYRDGLQIYTSTIPPVYPLRADAVLYTSGSTVTDAVLEPLVWMNTSGLSTQGATLTKTANDGWNAGASSTNTIFSGDGWMEFTAIETNMRRVAGLKANGSALSYADIDFAIDLGATGLISVYELGMLRGPFGSYADGDRLRVEIQNGIVRYRQNGVVFYTSAVAPVYPLHAEASLFSQSATLFDVAIGDFVWINDTKVRIFGNSLAKNVGTFGWDASAYSTKTINSGYMEFTASETTTDRTAGLTFGIKGQSYADIDFAIYFDRWGNYQVYQAGIHINTFGPYVPGDRFRVQVVNNVVQYLKNGVVFYTSVVAPRLPLRVDAATYEPSTSVFNVILVGQ